MRRKVYLGLEVFFLFLWWLALVAVLWDKWGGTSLTAVHPAKLLALPTVLTILFSRLERREKGRQEQQNAVPQGEG